MSALALSSEGQKELSLKDLNVTSQKVEKTHKRNPASSNGRNISFYINKIRHISSIKKIAMKPQHAFKSKEMLMPLKGRTQSVLKKRTFARNWGFSKQDEVYSSDTEFALFQKRLGRYSEKKVSRILKNYFRFVKKAKGPFFTKKSSAKNKEETEEESEYQYDLHTNVLRGRSSFTVFTPFAHLESMATISGNTSVKLYRNIDFLKAKTSMKYELNNKVLKTRIVKTIANRIVSSWTAKNGQETSEQVMELSYSLQF